MLDIATGNGNATLAAARRWAEVTSTDYVPALLDRAKARAEAECLSIAFQDADAEALPFEDDSFDAVLSTFGVMFTPNQTGAGRSAARATAVNLKRVPQDPGSRKPGRPRTPGTARAQALNCDE